MAQKPLSQKQPPNCALLYPLNLREVFPSLEEDLSFTFKVGLANPRKPEHPALVEGVPAGGLELGDL